MTGLLARAEARIATLETENEDVTSEFHAARDLADAHAKEIERLEVEIARVGRHDHLMTRKFEAADAKIAGLQRHVQELEAILESLWRDVGRCREIARQAVKDRTLAEVELGGNLKLLESVQRDRTERTEDVWRLEQQVRELQQQLERNAKSTPAPVPAVTLPFKTEAVTARHIAAVVPMPLPQQQRTKVSARHDAASDAARLAAPTRSSESEAAGRRQRKRAEASASAGASPSARMQTKTKTTEARAPSGRASGTAGAATRTGREAASAAAAKPIWR